MTEVTIEKVNKIYERGNVHAVQNLNLQIKDGEFVALLGPSGCGKTSTLRMIVGLEAISSGTIRFDDEIVNDKTPEQRNVAMAFESYALYPNLSIAENLAFPWKFAESSLERGRRKSIELRRCFKLQNFWTSAQVNFLEDNSNEFLWVEH